MNIGIIGYGKMGKIIAAIAKDKGHSVITIDPTDPEADHKEINKATLGSADICIDFTHPEAIMHNIKAVAALKKNLVVGTTGWYKHVDEVRSIVKKEGIGFLYATNFSIGMNIFFRLVENAAKIMNKFDSYDVGGIGIHHNKKADSPSGTAISIANILKDNIDRKDTIVYEHINRKIKPNELQFASLTAGSIPGTHTVLFDSPADTIELTHTARSREGFALGAVMAAEWLGKKKGFFTIDDMMKELI